MPTATAYALISASDLKRQRGWTEGLIGQLLGAPDALAPNPHGFRPPMRFFARDRILDAEQADAFRDWAARLDDRRTWRRTQPTRSYRPADIEHLEWLDHPRNIALFLTPRVPRRKRQRRAEPPPAPTGLYPLGRYEVLTLF
ncbi:hypothetical protein DSM112329_02735 [Paraconexibacter sp. AEG42_29]|uniref:Uncharacterized protein n=1 Tax=Paraconexibacter sp. AEG42_29 TaxID=2997339 RepID=A0AAU7AWM9_9ACTN